VSRSVSNRGVKQRQYESCISIFNSTKCHSNVLLGKLESSYGANCSLKLAWTIKSKPLEMTSQSAQTPNDKSNASFQTALSEINIVVLLLPWKLASSSQPVSKHFFADDSQVFAGNQTQGWDPVAIYEVVLLSASSFNRWINSIMFQPASTCVAAFASVTPHAGLLVNSPTGDSRRRYFANAQRVSEWQSRPAFIICPRHGVWWLRIITQSTWLTRLQVRDFL
jgi:hypothetical protein